jgi:uncharacterized membrane-anchored protein YitT (DUF2179 family)
MLTPPTSPINKYLKSPLWKNVRDYFLILFGSLLQGFAMRLFLIPAQLVSGGISGTAQIVEFYTHYPIGLMILIGNAPLFIIGWRYLGGLRFALRTIIAVAAVSFFTDFLIIIFPTPGITSDIVLQSIYGGLFYGIGLGLVYRGQGTSGGSDILCRILSRYLGMQISTSYLLVDTLVVLAGGFAFGWDKALYGIIVIYVSGLGAEIISEGSNIFRSVMIISDQSEEIKQNILKIMERGVTVLSGTGGYTGKDRPVLYCVITRSEIIKLKTIVSDIDPDAFMVIGQASEALGEGFLPLK